MSIMTEEHKQDQEQTFFLPGEAVEYLRKHRGIVISVVALRQRRLRGTAKAAHTTSRNSLWTKEELDRLEVSPRTKQVPPESLT